MKHDSMVKSIVPYSSNPEILIVLQWQIKTKEENTNSSPAQ